jgi:hypothetical protein
MEITVQYFEGCPNVELLRQRLTKLGFDLGVVRFQPMGCAAEAQQSGFRGSPTILVGGIDPFADTAGPVGLACRFYLTEEGREGAPSAEQLTRALPR